MCSLRVDNDSLRAQHCGFLPTQRSTFLIKLCVQHSTPSSKMAEVQVGLSIERCHVRALHFDGATGLDRSAAEGRSLDASVRRYATRPVTISYPLLGMLGETIRNACVNVGIDPDTHDGVTRNVWPFVLGDGEQAFNVSAVDPRTSLQGALRGCTTLLLVELEEEEDRVTQTDDTV